MHDIKDIVEVILFASNRPINQEDIEKVIDGENFDIRKELIEYAVIHRCDGNNPPKLNT